MSENNKEELHVGDEVDPRIVDEHSDHIDDREHNEQIVIDSSLADQKEESVCSEQGSDDDTDGGDKATEVPHDPHATGSIPPAPKSREKSWLSNLAAGIAGVTSWSEHKKIQDDTVLGDEPKTSEVERDLTADSVQKDSPTEVIDRPLVVGESLPTEINEPISQMTAPIPGEEAVSGLRPYDGNRQRPARKARLRLSKVDPWSVMKTSLMFSVAAAIVVFIAVALVWSLVEASGSLEKLQDAFTALFGNADGTGAIQVSSYIDIWRVLGFTALMGAINVFLMTAMATLGAFLYNLSSSILGGLEITLAED